MPFARVRGVVVGVEMLLAGDDHVAGHHGARDRRQIHPRQVLLDHDVGAALVGAEPRDLRLRGKETVGVHQGLPVLAAGEVLVDLLGRCVEADGVVHATTHGFKVPAFQAFSVIHTVVKRCSAISRSTSRLPMKVSILPPTSGTRTSTVALKSSREPVPDSCRGQHRGARQRHRCAGDGAVDGGIGPAVADRAPFLFALDAQVAAMELRDDAGQPVGAQHLGRDDVDAPVIADDHRIQRRIVGAGIRQSSQPVVFVAECPVDLFDADFVFGGHVE